MPDEVQGGGGSFLTQKWMGLPAIVWIGGAALLAYFFISRSQGSQPTNSTSGGGGQVHTGKTVVQSGAVRINVNANDDGNPQPKPPHHHHGKGGGTTKSLSVPKDETLGQFGESRSWSADTLQEVTQLKQPQGTTYAGQKLALNFPLKKGDTIARPWGKGS